MKSPMILYTEAETLYRGARCAVYRAHREDNGSPVILKALRYEPAPDREVARFKREYELTHRLNLPGVIGCYELISGADRHIMVLEDFGGQSLDRLRTAYRIDLLTFLEIAYAASTALAALHERGIIHGNVSPSNIVFNTQNGQLKLIDFGCAIDLSDKRAASNKYRSSGDEVDLPYASPEQITRPAQDDGHTSEQWAVGERKSRQFASSPNGEWSQAHRPATGGPRQPAAAPVVDCRSDLYSLGVTLYELLTGRLPFTDDGVSGGHDNRPTPPDQLSDRTPARVSEILLRLIEKDPDRRYQSAMELVADLAATSMSELAGEPR